MQEKGVSVHRVKPTPKTAEAPDRTDNDKRDHTPKNDNGEDCRMDLFWMGDKIFQHSPRHVAALISSF